jgi:hypothetical protein
MVSWRKSFFAFRFIILCHQFIFRQMTGFLFLECCTTCEVAQPKMNSIYFVLFALFHKNNKCCGVCVNVVAGSWREAGQMETGRVAGDSQTAGDRTLRGHNQLTAVKQKRNCQLS